MTYLLVKQKVKDFNKWYSVFASHAQAQHDAGLRDLKLLRDNVNPNIVICLFRVEDIEKAKTFTEAPQAEEAQVESGIIGTPEVFLLNEI